MKKYFEPLSAVRIFVSHNGHKEYDGTKKTVNLRWNSGFLLFNIQLLYKKNQLPSA